MKNFTFTVIFKKMRKQIRMRNTIYKQILEFLSLPLTTHKLDIFHAGQRLSSAFKSSIDGSLWSGSYVSVGIIYETLGTKFIWELFDRQTIGSMIFLDLIYMFLKLYAAQIFMS